MCRHLHCLRRHLTHTSPGCEAHRHSDRRHFSHTAPHRHAVRVRRHIPQCALAHRHSDRRHVSHTRAWSPRRLVPAAGCPGDFCLPRPILAHQPRVKKKNTVPAHKAQTCGGWRIHGAMAAQPGGGWARNLAERLMSAGRLRW
jgi:hypothetical protein